MEPTHIFFLIFFFIIVKRLLKGFSGLTVIFGDIFSVMTIVKRWLNPYGRNGKKILLVFWVDVWRRLMMID